MTIRVLVVDDQRVVRDGLTMLLGLVPDVEVVGDAADGAHALDQIASLAPDVVLMDLHMPRLDGTEATRRIRSDHPHVQVIVLTTYAHDDAVFGALDAGARGYLTKDAGADDIADAITAVAAGAAAFDPSVQARLLDRLSHPPPQRAGGAPAAPLPDGLTAREGEVLAHIAAGLSNREIADQLVVSDATVKTHINRIFAKTGVRDRAQAVTYAYRNGLVTP